MRYIKLSLAFAILFIFTSCLRNLTAPTVSKVDNFKMNKMSADGIDAEIKITIKNPNSIGFTVYKSFCDVTYAGKKLGVAKFAKKVRIPANSEREHTFILIGDFKGMNLSDITMMVGKGGTLELDGNIKVGKWFYKKSFPFNKSQKISPSR